MKPETPRRRGWLTTLGVALLLFLVVLGLSAIPVVNEAELRLGDSLFRIAPRPSARSPVVLVLIDDQSLRQYGRWPWSRALLARMVANLGQAGASAIGLDILLSEPQSETADRDLHDAMALAGRVVIVDKIGTYPDGPHWIEPLPAFAAAAARIGHAQAVLDRDGVCRRFPPRELRPEGSHWAFALELAREVDRARMEAFLHSYGVPATDDSASVTVAAPVLVPIAFRRGGFQTISAATVLGGGDVSAVQGRPVIVGFGPTEIGDRVSTPLGGELPAVGVEVNAQILDSVLTDRRLREPPPWVPAAMLLVVCLGVVWLSRRFHGWLAAGSLILAAIVVYLGAAGALLWKSLLLPVGPGLLAVALGPVLAYTADFVLVERSVAQQLRELRRWMASRRQGEGARGSDLFWRLAVLQQLQRELGSAYELHTALLAATQDLVAVFGADGEMLLRNERFAAAFGGAKHLTLAETQARLSSDRNASLVATGDGMEGESEIGGELYAVRIAPLPATTMSPGGGAIVTLASLRARVERDRARDEALGFVTHELRTPLVAIQGFAELMMRYPGSPACAGAPDTIFREAKRLVALINSYLDVLRLESGARVVRSDVVRLEETVREVFEVLHPLAAASNMYFVQEEGGTSPVIGDAPLLAGAVLNLVSNAVRYGRPGTEVRVGCTEIKGQVALRVHNVGAPISPQELARLFDPYYRAPRAESAMGGSGLGLAFVKRIAETHGGSVRVESDSSGTWFEIQLPAASAMAMGTAEAP